MTRSAALSASLFAATAIAAGAGQGDPARQQLLPTGRLRVGINAGNQVTRVVGPELGRELARRLATDVIIVEYDTPGAAADAVEKEWDVAFIAADPDREAAIAFTPAYLHLDATYLVRGDSRFGGAGELDATGVRVASGVTSAYTLVLRRELRRAQLVLLDTDVAVTALREGRVEAVAGLRGTLLQSVQRFGDVRVLADNFTVARQAIAVPRANMAALDYLKQFVEDVLRSGMVKSAIEKVGFAGASVP